LTFYRREYADPAAPWEFVGKSPLNSVRQPRGMFVWKFEKPGYGTALRTTNAVIRRYAVPRANPSTPALFCTRLTRSRQAWSWFPGGYIKSLFIPGYEGMPELDLPDYWIDQYEVTNRQFKAFVDAGGYQKRTTGRTNSLATASVFHGRRRWRNSKMPPDALARRIGSEANIPRGKMTIR